MSRDDRPRQILHVEDRAEDAELVRRILSKVGGSPEIHVRRDGEEAIAFLDTLAGAPLDLILLDLKVPKIDGHEVLRTLKGRPETARVPVVIFSSSREPGDVAEAYRGGANSYVVKPVTYAALRDAVSELATYWLERNQPVE